MVNLAHKTFVHSYENGHHLGRPRHNELSAHSSAQLYAIGRSIRRVQVSAATARRDLAALVKDHRIKRSYGGALVDLTGASLVSQRRHRHWAPSDAWPR